MKKDKKNNILYIIFSILGALPVLIFEAFPILIGLIILFFTVLLCLSLGTFGIFILIAMIITFIIFAAYFLGDN